MFSSKHTLFLMFTLVIHAFVILLITGIREKSANIIMAKLEISAVVLNLSDATEDSQPSPPPPTTPEKIDPLPEQPEPIPEPIPPEPIPEPIPPEPIPEPIPEPELLPVVQPEPEPVVLPELKDPIPEPPPPEPEPEPKPEPPPPEPEPKPEPPPPEPEPEPEPPPPEPEPEPKPPEPKPEPEPMKKEVEQNTAINQTPPELKEQPPEEITNSNTPQSGAAAAQIDVPPKPRRTIKPRYPAGARRRGEEGAVVLNVQINSDGRSIRVTIDKSSGSAELDQAAKRSVQKARFIPGKKDGRAIDSEARLTIIFKLR